MSLSKICPNYSLRLTVITLAAAVAGCSTNTLTENTAPEATANTSALSEFVLPSPEATRIAYGSSHSSGNQPMALAEGAPEEYVVQVGDTLWDIAATFLRDPWFWPEIWYVNPDIVNPHLIYPGDVLGLVYIEGQPRITNVRASTYRLSPQARVTPLTEAVESIPYESVAAFLSSGVVLEKKEADNLPYLIATRGDHLVAAAGNEVYVRGVATDMPGTRFNVVHIGDPLRDPDDNRLIGYHGILVGEGSLRRGGDPATVALTDTNREVLEGDRLIPEAVDVPLNFFPRAPSGPVEGRIIYVAGGVTQIGQYQVVIVNRGTNNGLSVGDVLTVYKTGETIKDRIGGGKVTLPDEEAGTVMVFKTFDRISYGLVMEAQTALHVLDTVRNPS